MYRFCIGVNPADVLELDPVLGDCVLHDPLKATALFQSVSENWAKMKRSYTFAVSLTIFNQFLI